MFNPQDRLGNGCRQFRRQCDTLHRVGSRPMMQRLLFCVHAMVRIAESRADTAELYGRTG